MVSKYTYYHIEPVNHYRDDIQYIVRYPKDANWVLVLENIAKRYLRGSLREVKVFTVGPMGPNDSAKVILNGALWRDFKGNLMWGSTSHRIVSAIDTKHHTFIDYTPGRP